MPHFLLKRNSVNYSEQPVGTGSIIYQMREFITPRKTSYYFISVRQNEKLIGCGRIISDGHIHALIVDMIILPEYQGRGIGKKILEMLVSHCREKGIIDIRLFSAKNKAGFYLKNNFKLRPDDAPGMQYNIHS